VVVKFTVVKLVTALTLGLFSAALTADAEQTGRICRIGVPVSVPRPVPASPHPTNAFLRELRDLGYLEAQNVTIEWRHTEGDPERRHREAAALVKWKPDVVLTVSGAEALALRNLDTSIPIVVAAGGDLVAAGLADSLARPGGNVTGLQILQADMAAKRLEILRELMARLQRVALLHAAPTRGEETKFYSRVFAELDTAARTLSVRVRAFTVASGDDVDRVFPKMSATPKP
jgi:ABC-type uncharacterized transport system substrate-binding protein